jgi:hypothetical protein
MQLFCADYAKNAAQQPDCGLKNFEMAMTFLPFHR